MMDIVSKVNYIQNNFVQMKNEKKRYVWHPSFLLASKQKYKL
jgi:hypothetical protein